MSDSARGFIIGAFVGVFGGMLIGALVVSMVREYITPTGFFIDYGYLIFIIIGAIAGVVGANRMLQNMANEEEQAG